MILSDLIVCKEASVKYVVLTHNLLEEFRKGVRTAELKAPRSNKDRFGGCSLRFTFVEVECTAAGLRGHAAAPRRSEAVRFRQVADP